MKPKSVPIELDGKTYHLAYDLNALMKLGEEVKLNLVKPEGWKALGEEITFRKIRAIVWAGLLRENSQITLDEVGAMLDPMNLQAAIVAYTEAFRVDDDAPKVAAA